MEPSFEQQTSSLQALNGLLVAIEDSRSNELAAEGDKANIDLVSVLNALTFASMFLDEHKVESGAFKRILSDLVAISEGANPSAMLRPRPTAHRRPIAPPIEAVKGRPGRDDGIPSRKRFNTQGGSDAGCPGFF